MNRVLKGAAGVIYALWYVLVIQTVFEFQAWRCRRAKAYLLTHDSEFRRHYAGSEIVRRRDRLYQQGVSPMDPQIRDIWTMEEEMPPMAWPHR